jgi:uncharacterized protein (DUF697 family)
MSWLDTLERMRTRDFSKATPEERDTAARDIINLCSYAAAVVAVVPLPFSDAVLSLPIQSAMVLTVGHIHGRKLSGAQARHLAVELGAVAGIGLLARQGIKAILPVVGALLTVPAAFAANWAMGRVAMEYFRDPDVSRAQLKKVYGEAVKEARSRFSRAEFERFRKANPDAAAPEKPSRPARTARKGAAQGSPRGGKKSSARRRAPRPS